MSKPEALRLADLCNKDGYMTNIERSQIEEELRRLHAEVEALKAESIEQCKIIGGSAETELRLRAENEALRKDAERYRWLMRSNIDAGAFVFSWKNEGRDPFTSIRASGTTNVAGLFDDTGEAIDAAMKDKQHE